MNLNFNIKVKAGPRTPASVSAYSTAINKKTVTLTNGVKITDIQIAGWLKESLQEALNKLQSESGEQI